MERNGLRLEKKSRIRETKNLLTDADSSTAGKKVLSIFFTPPRRRRQGAFGQKFGSEGGLANQRPWTDHVIWGLMRGRKKSYMNGDKQTDI